jgi:hypothetical protein
MVNDRIKERIVPDESRQIYVKLGTKTHQEIWIHEDDFPLEEGKHVRYTQGRHGWRSVGVVQQVGTREDVTQINIDDDPVPFVQMGVDGSLSEVEEWEM